MPDRARLTLGVEADGPTAKAAQAAVSARIADVLNALATLGLAKKDIRTRAFSLAISSGRRLAGALSISEESVSAPDEERGILQDVKFGLDEADAARTVEPGQVAVRARVRVEFATR